MDMVEYHIRRYSLTELRELAVLRQVACAETRTK